MTDYLTRDVVMLRDLLDRTPGDRALACALADELQGAGAPPGAVALARLDRVPWMYSGGAGINWSHLA